MKFRRGSRTASDYIRALAGNFGLLLLVMALGFMFVDWMAFGDLCWASGPILYSQGAFSVVFAFCLAWHMPFYRP